MGYTKCLINRVIGRYRPLIETEPKSTEYLITCLAIFGEVAGGEVFDQIHFLLFQFLIIITAYIFTQFSIINKTKKDLLRGCYMSHEPQSINELKKQLQALLKFPDQNPNPVLKTTMGGKLLYTNSAGQYIKDEWKIDIGDDVPSSVVDQSKLVSSLPLEMEVGNKTYAFHVVAVPEFDFINIYGTDVTAAEDNRLILLKLSKYFSPQVYESIFSGDLEVKIETRRKRLTVFFSDIKGFSELTERLEPEILTELVTSYLTEMTNIAIAHGGTVDKYIGDAIMVFFGDPKSLGHKEDAIACVQMAIAMVKALRSVRLSWENMGISQPLDIRIGIHTDTCTVGNFGSHDRLDYTTIGNGVNLASRLETNAEPNQILISEDTYLLVREKIKCRKLNKIRVKNIAHPIQTYEVVAHLNLDLLEEAIKEESDGFSVYIDPKTIDQIEKKKEILERALNLLSQID